MAALDTKVGTLISGWCMTGHHEKEGRKPEAPSCRGDFSGGACPCHCHADKGIAEVEEEKKKE